MPAPVDLFTCDLTMVDEAQLREFVTDAIAARAQAESQILEFKSQRNRHNVVASVAGMANTDGGVVLLGVGEESSDPLVGVSAKEVDRTVQSLRALPPDAMPETMPIALGTEQDRVVLILRVNADEAEQPVVVAGKVYVRIPGHTVGATRDQILALFTRASGSAMTTASGIPIDVARVTMWEPDVAAKFEVRAAASAMLPRRAAAVDRQRCIQRDVAGPGEQSNTRQPARSARTAARDSGSCVASDGEIGNALPFPLGSPEGAVSGFSRHRDVGPGHDVGSSIPGGRGCHGDGG